MPEIAGKLVVETQPESLSVPPPEQQAAGATQSAWFCGADDRAAGFGQNDVVQAARRYAAVE